MKALYLPLKALPDGTQEFRYKLGPDFFREMECGDVLSADVDAEVSVSRRGDVFGLTVTVKGAIGIPCDRCLAEMRHAVDATYSVSVRLGDTYDDSDDQVITIPESRGVIDASRIVCDTVTLTIPLRHTHPDGECDPDMQARLDACRVDDAPDQTTGQTE